MNKQVLTVVSFSMALLSASCHSSSNPREEWQTRVAWLPACPHDPQPVTQGETNRAAAIGLLFAAIAPKLIEGVVDATAASLKAAGESKSISTSARSASYFYKVSRDGDLKLADEINCLVVVRGRFDAKAASPADLQWANNSPELKGLQVPVILFEAKVVPVRGLKFFQLQPRYLKVTEFEHASVFSSKDRDYSISFSLYAPGVAQPFGSDTFSFKGISEGEELKHDDWRLRAASTMPISLPPESADTTQARTKRQGQVAPYLLALGLINDDRRGTNTPARAPSVYEVSDVQSAADTYCNGIRDENARLSQQFRIHDDRCTQKKLEGTRVQFDVALKKAELSPARLKWARDLCKPTPAKDDEDISCQNYPEATGLAKPSTFFTTQAALTETREGNKFAAYLGTALGAAKTDIANALKDKVLPTTQTQKDADTAAALNARRGVVLADMEVTKAEEALAAFLLDEKSKPADVTGARIALVKAKIAANNAYLALGLAAPYPELN